MWLGYHSCRHNQVIFVNNWSFWVTLLSMLCCALSFKVQITTKIVCFCRLHNVLEAFPTNSVDSDHCLSLYLTLLNNVSKNLQQTTNADRIFRGFFAGVLRAILPSSKSTYIHDLKTGLHSYHNGYAYRTKV